MKVSWWLILNIMLQVIKLVFEVAKVCQIQYMHVYITKSLSFKLKAQKHLKLFSSELNKQYIELLKELKLYGCWML